MIDIKIKDVTPFIEDWECPQIIGRKEQIDHLNNTILNPLIDAIRCPSSVAVYGGSGSGKTFVITKLAKEDTKYIKKNIPTFEYFYYNLKDQGVPSYYTILLLLASELEKYLPVTIKGLGAVDQVLAKGWDRHILLKVIKEIVKQKKLCILLVVDEVDRLYSYEKNEDFFYTFAEMYKSFKSEECVGITTIFISNNIHLFKSLPIPTRDRIPYLIHFTPYSTDELYKILKTTSEYAIEGDIQDSLLLQVANDVYNGNKSAREAKLLLYNLLTTESFDEARLQTDKDLLKDEISRLTLDQLLVIHSVIQRQEDTNKMLLRNNPGRYRYRVEPTAGSIFDIYYKSSQKLGREPKTYKTFKRISDALEKDALLKTQLKSLGRARGITTLMYPGESVDILKPLISEYLTHRVEEMV